MFIPPIVEETVRLITLMFGLSFAIVFTATFSSIEFLYYILTSNDSTGPYFIIRLICIALHFIYLSIHVYGYRLYKETDEKGYIVTFYLSAIIAHVLWNGILGKLTYSFMQAL